MLSRQDRGERAWHQHEAAWQRRLAKWAREDARHYPGVARTLEADRALAVARHKAAIERSRHYGQPRG